MRGGGGVFWAMVVVLGTARSNVKPAVLRPAPATYEDSSARTVHHLAAPTGYCASKAQPGAAHFGAVVVAAARSITARRLTSRCAYAPSNRQCRRQQSAAGGAACLTPATCHERAPGRSPAFAGEGQRGLALRGDSKMRRGRRGGHRGLCGTGAVLWGAGGPKKGRLSPLGPRAKASTPRCPAPLSLDPRRRVGAGCTAGRQRAGGRPPTEPPTALHTIIAKGRTPARVSGQRQSPRALARRVGTPPDEEIHWGTSGK